MGLWAMKAEQRWRAVLEMDPNHWQAQNNVAFSLSQYPDFLNKTGESINEYEKLVTIQENMVLENYKNKDYSSFGLLRFNNMKSRALDLIERFDIRCPGPSATTRQLSGGNMQKLILGRVLEALSAHGCRNAYDTGIP